MRFILHSTFLGLVSLGCTTTEGTVFGLNSGDAAATDSGAQGGSANGGQDASVTDGGGLIADAASNPDGSTSTLDGSVPGAEAGAGCGAGQICFALDGDAIVASGGGYALNEVGLGDYLFVKYEMGLVQLSIDIFATEPGTYDASEAREAGKARVYYFDENGGEFMSSEGTVTITAVDNGTVTGTFSATLEEFDFNTQMFTGAGSPLEVSDGTFVEILTPAI
jgi:hypothetical protein